MYNIKNFAENPNIVKKSEGGPFTILEYIQDKSVTFSTATNAYFAAMMNVHERQVYCDLSQGDILLQAGAMQWMLGDVSAATDVKGVGDFFGKIAKGAVTKESAIKPRYTGKGCLVTEPTYNHLFLLNPEDFGGSIMLSDSMFLAAEASLKQEVIMRNNVSSAVLGGEGLFNLCLSGNGFIVCESGIPYEEIIEINLENDVVKIDGPMALAWSKDLQFTVERTTKTLIGSAASGEGLVNVYRGTGKILMSPLNYKNKVPINTPNNININL